MVVAVIVIVAGPVIVAVHVHGNATVGVIEGSSGCLAGIADFSGMQEDFRPRSSCVRIASRRATPPQWSRILSSALLP